MYIYIVHIMYLSIVFNMGYIVYNMAYIVYIMGCQQLHLALTIQDHRCQLLLCPTVVTVQVPVQHEASLACRP